MSARKSLAAQPGGKRLLILEDRAADAERLVSREPIKTYVGTSAHESLVIRDVSALEELTPEDKKASIWNAQTVDVALELIRRQRFDFIISDLLLFHPRLVNEIEGSDYFRQLPLEDTEDSPGRLSQIASPAGLNFIKEVRTGERGAHGTPRTVPVIAMTFFWRHPRFDALYLRQLTEIEGPAAVGYLPKYYWIRNDKIEKKGDAALRQLIPILEGATGNSPGVKELLGLIFDAVALELFVYKNRLDLYDSIEALRASYHTSCRSVVDFTLLFELAAITRPAGDLFQGIMGQLLAGNEAPVGIAVRFANIPAATERTDGIVRGRRLSAIKEDFLKIGTRRHKPNVDRAKLRKFAICLALALYTYPLASEPHCLTNDELAALVSKVLGEPISEQTIRTDVNSIRDELQTTLPADLGESISARNHLVVTHGHRGYYLNGTYRLQWDDAAN